MRISHNKIKEEIADILGRHEIFLSMPESNPNYKESRKKDRANIAKYKLLRMLLEVPEGQSESIFKPMFDLKRKLTACIDEIEQFKKKSHYSVHKSGTKAIKQRHNYAKVSKQISFIELAKQYIAEAVSI